MPKSSTDCPAKRTAAAAFNAAARLHRGPTRCARTSVIPAARTTRPAPRSPQNRSSRPDVRQPTTPIELSRRGLRYRVEFAVEVFLAQESHPGPRTEPVAVCGSRDGRSSRSRLCKDHPASDQQHADQSDDQTTSAHGGNIAVAVCFWLGFERAACKLRLGQLSPADDVRSHPDEVAASVAGPVVRCTPRQLGSCAVREVSRRSAPDDRRGCLLWTSNEIRRQISCARGGTYEAVGKTRLQRDDPERRRRRILGGGGGRYPHGTDLFRTCLRTGLLQHRSTQGQRLRSASRTPTSFICRSKRSTSRWTNFENSA